MIKTDTTPANNIDRFQVRWVFGGISDAMRQQLIAFWLKEGALQHADEAWRRASEVACVLLEGEDEELAGVCTVAIALDDASRSYGFVRIFIRPQSRLVGLGRQLVRRMIAGFNAMAGEPGAPRRLLATLENRKLEGRAGQRRLTQMGFVTIGTAPNGEVVVERKLAP